VVKKVLVTLEHIKMVVKPFSKYLTSDLIFFLKAQDRDEAVRQLISHCAEAGKVESMPSFYSAVIDREKVVTTGIGMGIAIPHAKMSAFNDFFISVGILDKGIDWKALDGHPVRIIFLIGGPDDKQNEYLKILSSLTLSIKDDQTRKDLLNSSSPEEAYRLLIS
jgi:PTS system nitrogen regulatory IIA component